MKETLLAELRKVRHWLTLKGACVPLLAGYGVRQWTDIARARYPGYVIIDLAVLYSEDGGSRAIFAIDEDRYRLTASALFAHLEDLQRIYDEFCADERAFDTAARRLTNAVPQEFETVYADFIKTYDAVYSSGIMIDGFLVYGDTFVAEMREKYPAADTAIDTLTTPYGLPFAQREQRDLLAIALAPAAEAQQRLQTHHAAYHWIHNNYKDAQGLPFTYFQSELTALQNRKQRDLQAEVERLASYDARQQRACEKIREEGVFASGDYDRLLWLGKIAWWMDRRKERNLIANFFIDQFAARAAARLSTTRERILFLLPSELEDVLHGRTSLADYPLEERAQESAIVYADESNWAVFTSADARAVREIINPPTAVSAETLTGMSACPGHARGRVRIVFDPRKQDFPDGDILVTPMTRPDFLPLMKRAAAIVTDEGGITSHAAIISRELRKPCVIGTKMATRALHDGDLVEVDAEQGVVRVLKREATR